MSRRIEKWHKLTEPAYALMTIALAIAGGIVSAYIYLNSVVISRVDESFRPYDHYLAANVLFTNGDPNGCLRQIVPAIEQLNKDFKSSPIASASYDLMLACARDSSSPEDYKNLIKIFERRLDAGELPESAFHQGALAWYYLQTGDKDRAEGLFKNAISAFSAEGNKVEVAYSCWGLTLIELLRGDAKDAWNQYSEAAKLSPNNFNLSLGEAPVLSELNSFVGRRFRHDPILRATLPGFVTLIRRKQAGAVNQKLENWLKS